MNVDIKSMFESIKDSLKEKEKQGNSLYKDILKMEPGNTYIVRLIPNAKDPKSTFFHYYHHGWTSLSTGQYVDTICMKTFNERCPVCEARFKLYKTKKEENKKLAYIIRQLEKHLVNVYVVSDPTNSENDGTIKILRCGKRLYEKINAAIDGDDVEEFGSRVFDLTENGCSFKIKVETTSEGNKKFANYNNSRFTAPSTIAGITPQKIQEIYEHMFDLSTIVSPTTEVDMKNMLQSHLFANEVAVKKEAVKVDEPANIVPNKPEPTDELVGLEGEIIEPSLDEHTASVLSTLDEDKAKLKELIDGIDTM